MKKNILQEIAERASRKVAKSNYITRFTPVRDYIEANKTRKPSGTFGAVVAALPLKQGTWTKAALLKFREKVVVGCSPKALDGSTQTRFF